MCIGLRIDCGINAYAYLCTKMFFPVESLKRGGRFYLCWVADSWPLRFATITHRQLCSQDIRNICDDLMEVVISESGAPSRRFSLRLSSQLMRGLVRLYQRKVTIFLGELCMLNANVTKHVNKKFVFHEEVTPVRRTLPPLPPVVPELPEREEGVEEMIQRSDNVVANVEEITLKESALPEVPLLNDNFGEAPEQTDRTLELMLGADLSVAHQSIEFDKSTDKSRLHDPRIEKIPEHELSLFSKSGGDEQLQIGDVTKEIPGIPDVPTTPLPAPPAPLPQVEKEKEIDIEMAQEIPPAPVEELRQKEPEDIVLEELEEPQPAKRRRVKSRVIDKQIKLSSAFLRARIHNCAVELRCQSASDDIVQIIVPAHSLLSRAAHAGHRVHSALGLTPSRLFLRNLGTVRPLAAVEREMEAIISPVGRQRTSHRSVLEKIDEEIEPLHDPRQPQPPTEIPDPTGPEIPLLDITVPDINVPDITVRDINAPEDISDMPTQIIPTLSQRKRSAEREIGDTSKSPRRSRHSRPSRQEIPTIVVEAPNTYPETNKENISDNVPQEFRQSDKDLVTVMSMLQEAGLEDPPRPERSTGSPRAPLQARQRSESTETPLGSLDRTKVSLGDSVNTTDSIRFIRDEWGTQGTMVKIIMCIKEGSGPLDVRALLARGPAITKNRKIIAARCFTSILKLVHHRFIKVIKDPETLEIRDIILGEKFEAV